MFEITADDIANLKDYSLAILFGLKLGLDRI